MTHTATATPPDPGMSSATPAKGVRLALFVGGLITIGFGVAVLLWPTRAAVALTAVVATYAVLTGLVYAAMGVMSKTLGAGGRIGHVMLGILYVVAGVYAFTELERSAAFLALFVTLMIGVMWVIEGFMALFTLGASGSKPLTVVFAVISVIAGLLLLGNPLWGALSLWWFLGFSLVLLGLLNVLRAFTGRQA